MEQYIGLKSCVAQKYFCW